VATVLLALVGLYYLSRFVIHAVLGLLFSASFKAETLTALQGFVTNGSGWIATVATVAVALATYYLWKATRALSRSTNVQFAIGGPLLVSVLYPPGGFPQNAQDVNDPFARVVVRPYLRDWMEEDQRGNLQAVSGDAAPAFLNLYVWNRSQSVHGVGAKISVTATLHFGGPGTTQNHPYSLARTAEIPLCEPGAMFGLQLFNIGGLKNLMVTVDEMTYYDLMGRERRGGWGYAVLYRNAAGTEIYPKLFQPRKGEYTDEV
jgi:hypothetical protein